MAFFRGLARNNRREWFMDRKEVYEESVKAPMTALVAALNAEMMRFAPEYATDPARAIYRIYRDVRFSHDKTPYKIHIAASFWRKGHGETPGRGILFQRFSEGDRSGRRDLHAASRNTGGGAAPHGRGA